MNDVLLYEGALQVVPLLLIALFLDTHDEGWAGLTPRARWWIRTQDKTFAVLGILAFMTSLLVVAGVAEPRRLTDAVVISTLSLAISLLFARIWRRFDQAPRRTSS